MARHRTRQFLEKRRAIVGRHFVQNCGDLFVRHRMQKSFLFLDVEIFENVGRQRRRQHAKDNDRIVVGKIRNYFRQVGRRKFAKSFAQRVEVTRLDQTFDFGDENFADHK